MNKEAILKAFGGSEEDFYKMYPTEEHFKKAMGGAFEAYSGPVPDFFNPQFIMDEGGNVASPMNYGAFPAMNEGGNIPCMNCGGVSMKEGGSADQGLNQEDILKQQKDTFLGFIQGNTQKALMKEIHEELMGEMMRYGGIPKAQYGYQANKDADYEEYLRWKQSKQIPYTQNYNPNSGYTGMNYFPMNRSQTWKPGKKDLETMNSLSKDAKYTGFKANYGPLGRLAPRMFGPKSYEFNFSDVNPATSQGPGVNLLDKNNPLYDPNKDVSTPGQAGSLYQSSKPDGRNAINHAINPYFTMEYGGIPIAQEGQTVLSKPGSPYMTLPTINTAPAPTTEFAWSADSSISNNTPVHPAAGTLNNIEMKDYGPDSTDRVNKTVKTTRRNNFNGEEAANWLLAGMSNASYMLEGRDRRAAEDRMEMLQAGDNQFLATQGNRGDYDINSGLFRVDQEVPVQFSGAGLTANNGQTNYQFGGANEEELELTDEEIAAIEAAGGQVEYLD